MFANESYKKISLYIARLGSQNNMLSSSPCVECYKQMKKFDIKTLVYSESNGKITKTRMRNFISNHISSGSRAFNSNRITLLHL